MKYEIKSKSIYLDLRFHLLILSTFCKLVLEVRCRLLVTENRKSWQQYVNKSNNKD